MKTLTELSGSVIRAAAAALAEARRTLPSDEKPAGPAVPEASAQEAPPATGDATAETAVSAEAPATPPAPPPATPRRAVESGGPAKEAIDAALAKATGLSGDRLTMLRGAVEAVGRRAEDVRLVRVFGLEEQVAGATKVGAYQYVVDLFPPSMKQVTAPRDDRGRRGGGRGGGGRGGGRGGGDRGAKGSSTGGFSMDSLRDDRKNERGGRGRPGGGTGGRGGPGRPPGGSPKK